MTDYLGREISEVNDADFQTFVGELCQCLDWNEDDFKNKTLANIFSAIVAENKKLDSNKILDSQILDRKVKRFPLNSAIWKVCRELAKHKNKSMDDFAGQSVLTLIKEYLSYITRSLRPKQPGWLQLQHQFDKKLILRRRRNGSL